MASRGVRNAVQQDRVLRAAAGEIAQAFAAADADPALLHELANKGASNDEVVRVLGIDDPELEAALAIVREHAERLNREFPGALEGYTPGRETDG